MHCYLDHCFMDTVHFVTYITYYFIIYNNDIILRYDMYPQGTARTLFYYDTIITFSYSLRSIKMYWQDFRIRDCVKTNLEIVLARSKWFTEQMYKRMFVYRMPNVITALLYMVTHVQNINFVLHVKIRNESSTPRNMCL